ncbi:SAF domain-containing protein [Kitasatospora kifunensis]|uniref:Guanyl-specific ribonuclease Sa n=1 Tax=Kitasatospora kifunensis TaxID=58351 RepID=A0A7W7VZ03_KITKI|nr:SAF domain-containing protein [Kitasatospora kifunensis]MBB4928272.1 guanyl-specific ribonuclease Sa [Kitasatospora kifunensis]
MALITQKRRSAQAEDPGRRQPAALPITDSAPRRSRRPALVAIGVALAAVGGLGSAYFVTAAGHRTDVIAVARDIPAGQVITSADLVRASMVADPALHPVPVSRAHDILGQVAAMDLPAGSMVTDRSVRAGQPLTAGKDTVGVLAKEGQLPAEPVQPGQVVTVVQTPGQQDASGAAPGQPATISAVVVQVAAPDANGTRVVDLAVSPVDSPALASWAAMGRVAIVLKAAKG